MTEPIPFETIPCAANDLEIGDNVVTEYFDSQSMVFKRRIIVVDTIRRDLHYGKVAVGFYAPHDSTIFVWQVYATGEKMKLLSKPIKSVKEQEKEEHGQVKEHDVDPNDMLLLANMRSADLALLRKWADLLGMKHPRFLGIAAMLGAKEVMTFLLPDYELEDDEDALRGI